MEQRPLLKDYQELPTEQEKPSPKRKDLAVTSSGGSHVQADGPLGLVSDLARLTLSPDNKKKQGAISTIIRELTHTPTEAESSISPITEHTTEEVDEDGFLLVPKVEKSVPNNPDAYRKEMILEGYLPVPPQNLWDRLCNYFSMNRQLTEKLIRIKEIEDDRDRYQATLDKSIEEELKKAYSSVDNYIQNETKNIIKYLKQKKQKDNTDSFNYKAHEDILKNLIGSRNDLVSEMIKKFSENREHATNVYISRLETEAKQSKQAQLFKLNSLVKMNGFGLRW